MRKLLIYSQFCLTLMPVKKKKIKKYIRNESKLSDEKTAGFIDWAKKKADWFDPTVAREDEVFGVREHEENEERKVLEKSYYW